jgi:hypothetical protein
MFQRFRDQVGTAGFVISIVALVAALGGGAYAASNGLTSKQKKEVKAIAKQFAGKPGATGPAGGTGEKGSSGSNGSNGSNGANGKGVETGVATVAECAEGGATVQVAGEAATKKKVCNGEEGPQGPEGSPWTAGGTLPSGKTERGVWAVPKTAEEIFQLFVPISFTIPTASQVSVHYVNKAGEEVIEGAGSPATVCTGSSANPTAPAGNLCVYEDSPGNGKVLYETVSLMEGAPVRTATKGGAVLVFYAEAGGEAKGAWAVTAP